MCVIAWAWRAHPCWPLVVLANRDERHERACAPLGWWMDHPDVLGGRDLEAGGGWLGVSRAGRFAAITNRNGTKPPGAPSRGELVAGFLTGGVSVAKDTAEFGADAPRYAGFNLLIADAETLALVSNREPARVLDPGIHGMANGELDEPVPKVARLVAALSQWCQGAGDPETEAWLALLADDTPAERSRPASAIFVRDRDYGTRSSSIVLFGADGSACFIERGFDAQGDAMGTKRVEFEREA